ncbi:MAG: CsgG/HfaB family protein [Elusimicrobiota bacterium]
MRNPSAVLLSLLCLGAGIAHASAGERLALLRLENAALPAAVQRHQLKQLPVDHAYDHLQAALTDMATTDLFQSLGSRLLERSRVEAMLEEISLSETGLTRSDSAAKAGQALRTDYAVFGTFGRRGPGFVLSPTLLELADGKETTLDAVAWTESETLRVSESITRAILSRVPLDPDGSRPQIRLGKTLAILPFNDNSAAQDKPLRASILNLLTSGMRLPDGVKLLERARLDRILDELRLGYSGYVDERTALTAGQLLGASDILIGSFMVVGGEIRLDARVCETETGRTLLAEKALGPTRFPGEAVKSLLIKINKRVGGNGHAAAPVPPRKHVLAVLPFENNTGVASLDPWGQSLAERLMPVLADVPGCTMVERTLLDKVLSELALQHSGAVDPATSQKLGKLLGADMLVLGGIEKLEDIRLTARLVRADTGEVAAGFFERGRSVDKLPEMADRLAVRIGDELSKEGLK